MEKLLGHLNDNPNKIKLKATVVKGWQRTTQCSVSTLFTFKLVEVLRSKYRNRDHQPVDPSSAAPGVRRAPVRALWDVPGMKQ
jgi:hypothetical protein